MRAVERMLAHQTLRFSVLDEQISREDLSIADEFGESDVISWRLNQLLRQETCLKRETSLLHAVMPHSLFDRRQGSQYTFSRRCSEGCENREVFGYSEVRLQILLCRPDNGVELSDLGLRK